MTSPTFSVVLPTYKRPEMLRLCLESLIGQTVSPLEISVGRRVSDQASAEVLAEFADRSGGIVREAVVADDGNLVVSMNAALAQTTGELVALTDDDAEAPPDWLERLGGYFDDATIGGVGGKDEQAANPGEAEVVGRLQWFGRIIGNHHLGVGVARDVEVLKGVNCCFRGDLLRQFGFDKRLRGNGNVSHWELALCFAVLRAGYRLVYDPGIVVVHHTAQRHDGDVNCRGGFNGPAHADAVYNETLTLLQHLSWPRYVAFIVWSIAIGTRAAPGMLQVPRIGVQRRSSRDAVTRCASTMRGRFAAFLSRLSSRCDATSVY